MGGQIYNYEGSSGFKKAPMKPHLKTGLQSQASAQKPNDYTPFIDRSQLVSLSNQNSDQKQLVLSETNNDEIKKPLGKLAKILSKNSSSKQTDNAKTIQNSIFKRKKPVNVSITVPRKHKNKIEIEDIDNAQKNAGNLTDRNHPDANKTPQRKNAKQEEEPQILTANNVSSARVGEILKTEEL